jgi:hypothetical protein
MSNVEQPEEQPDRTGQGQLLALSAVKNESGSTRLTPRRMIELKPAHFHLLVKL